MLKVATVCSGIGSPEQAIKELGIPHEVVFACEKDKYAAQTYAANHHAGKMVPDMTKEKWEGEEWYSDLFIGGIPCQAFSLAGLRLGENDPRGLLFFDFYRYVKNQQPKVFIIENVKGLLSDNNGKTFQNWVQLLARSVNNQELLFHHEDSLLYNLHYAVLNSKDYGVPQNRERVFIIGIRPDLPNNFRFPSGFRLEKRLKDILETDVSEKYYLSEKMLQWMYSHTEKKQKEGCGFAFKPVDLNGCAKAINARVYKMSIDDNYIQETVAGRIRGRNPENPKSRVAGLPTQQMFEPNDETDIINTLTTVEKDNVLLEKVIQINKSTESNGTQPYQQNRVYDPNGIAPTLNCRKETSNIIEKNRIRRLTPLECARLQAFPDNFILPVSETQQYRQFGNTITVSVIKAIIKNLQIILKSQIQYGSLPEPA